MDGKTAITISVFAAVLMLMPGISVASPLHSNVHQYQVGNEKVIFEGDQSFIAFGNSSEKVSWIVEKFTPGGLITEHLTHFRVRRIVNAYQNSAVLIENNSQIRIAEIYSFHNGMISASAALKNLGTSNSSYVVVFSIMTRHSGDVIVNGLHPLTRDGFNVGSPSMFVPVGDSSISEGNFHISWQNEASIFSQGLLTTDGGNNLLLLSFGPLNLARNETFSIDPHIRPMRIACPPSDYDNDCLNEPDHDGDDGTSGGGGGTTYYAPQVSLIVDTAYNDTISGGTTIDLTSDVTNSGNAGSVSVTLYALTSYNGNSGSITIGSITEYPTGAHQFPWTVLPGNYTGFEAIASSVGGKGYAYAGHGFGSYTMFPYLNKNSGSEIYPQQSEATEKIYNSSGDFGGFLTINMLDTVNGAFSDAGSATLTFQSSFMPYNTSTYGVNYWKSYGGVNEYQQVFAWDGNSLGRTPSNYIWLTNNNIYAGEQGTQNSSMTWNSVPVQSLWLALQTGLTLDGYTAPAGVIMAALYPIVFSPDPSSPSITGGGQSNQVTVGYNAGFFPAYYFIGTTSGQDAWMFNFTEDLKWYNNGASISGWSAQDAILNFFTYSATYWVSPSGDTVAPMLASISIPIYLAED
ncbi:hypothetical protein Thermo_00644 [Thermoplasmatales archaeon]|nr:hypothetical protein Thermo_00644 [Thermoplasmatales archaeon]